MTRDQKTIANLLHLGGYKLFHRDDVPAGMGHSTQRVISLEDIKDSEALKLLEEKGLEYGAYFLFVKKSNHLAKFYLKSNKVRTAQFFTIHYFKHSDGQSYSIQELNDFINYLEEKSVNE